MDPWISNCNPLNFENSSDIKQHLTIEEEANKLSSSVISDSIDLAILQNKSTINQDQGSQDSTSAAVFPTGDHQEVEKRLSFEDNFTNFIPEPESSESFVPLPDSGQYLDSLEKKLDKIKTKPKKEDGKGGGDLLKSLEQSRESCMVNLLRDSLTNSGLPPDTFDELKINPILKFVAPDKQAISIEELVHLVKADQLAEIISELDQNQDGQNQQVQGPVEVVEKPSSEEQTDKVDELKEPDKDKANDKQ